MPYKENPKTKGSGIICCIPQTGLCPNNCEDCYFQSGRSYLEPLNENLPNVPDAHLTRGKIVRMNDGNDSNVDRDKVIEYGQVYKHAFYNTSIPNLDFPGPVVLTINPGSMTTTNFHRIEDPPANLMFVRFRTNMWNLGFCGDAIGFYSEKKIPIVLTFMAYFEKTIPPAFSERYTFKKRTLNSYWSITTRAWERLMEPYRYNKWVYSCGKVEGEMGTTACRHCGNCLREYFATMERMKEYAKP